MMLPEQPLRATRSRGVTPQLVLGVMVIVIGVLMTLDNLELIQAERFLRFWPVGLVALGLVKLWHARQCRGGSFSGILLTTIGTWMLLEQTALVRRLPGVAGVVGSAGQAGFRRRQHDGHRDGRARQCRARQQLAGVSRWRTDRGARRM